MNDHCVVSNCFIIVLNGNLSFLSISFFNSKGAVVQGRPSQIKLQNYNKIMPKKKIDGGRALSIMGFASSRPLDACLGNQTQIRAVLDEALFKKTQLILHAPVKKVNPWEVRPRRVYKR